jgi:hypothetical protein
MEYKTIAVSPEVYKKIKALAHQNGRTIGKQVEWLVRDISLIPAPEDGHPITVLNVAAPQEPK